MKLTLFHVDAFASQPFGGNPAGIVPLEMLDEQPELSDETMLSLAREINLPMVAFVGAPNSDGVRAIRWFHADGESEFCGHATFAAGHVLLNELNVSGDRVEFDTRAGRLVVERSDNERLSLTVPAIKVQEIFEPRLERAIGCAPRYLAKGDLDILMLVDSQNQVESLTPDWSILREIDARGIVITAPASDEGVDFVSRFIATTPEGYEDAATGSAHAMLTPFWSERLSKRERLHALQLSTRGGEFWCDMASDDSVRLTGSACTFMQGEIQLSTSLVPSA